MSLETPLITVIDDDVDLLEVYRQILEKEGYRVRCCAVAQEAIAAVAAEAPNLIIVDLMMDALDSGFTLAKQLKARPETRHVPILLVTAITSQRGFDFAPRAPEDLAAMSVDAFLEKPVTPKSLTTKVAELLRAAREGALP